MVYKIKTASGEHLATFMIPPEPCSDLYLSDSTRLKCNADGTFLVPLTEVHRLQASGWSAPIQVSTRFKDGGCASTADVAYWPPQGILKTNGQN